MDKSNIIKCIEEMEKNIIPELNVNDEIILDKPSAIYLLDSILIFNPDVNFLQSIFCGKKNSIKVLFFSEIKDDIRKVLEIFPKNIQISCPSYLEEDLREIVDNIIVISEMQIRGHSVIPEGKKLKIKKVL